MSNDDVTGAWEARAGDAVGERLRVLVLAVFLAGNLGTGAELLLLEHTEDPWQWVPIVLMAVGAGMGVFLLVRQPVSLLRAFRVVALLFVVGGVLGLYLHYRGNAEFELEMYPSRAGFELFWESIKGATPALAPGALAQLGLLGLLYTFRHPATAGRRVNTVETQGASQ